MLNTSLSVRGEWTIVIFLLSLSHSERKKSIKCACDYFVYVCVDKILIYFSSQYCFLFLAFAYFEMRPAFVWVNPLTLTSSVEEKASYCSVTAMNFLALALLVGKEWPFKLLIMDSLWAFMRAQEPKWKKGRAALKKCKMHLWQRLLT